MISILFYSGFNRDTKYFIPIWIRDRLLISTRTDLLFTGGERGKERRYRIERKERGRQGKNEKWFLDENKCPLVVSFARWNLEWRGIDLLSFSPLSLSSGSITERERGREREINFERSDEGRRTIPHPCPSRLEMRIRKWKRERERGERVDDKWCKRSCLTLLLPPLFSIYLSLPKRKRKENLSKKFVSTRFLPLRIFSNSEFSQIRWRNILSRKEEEAKITKIEKGKVRERRKEKER